MPASTRRLERSRVHTTIVVSLVAIATGISVAASSALEADRESAGARIAALREMGGYEEALVLARAELARLRAPVMPAPSWEVTDAEDRVRVLEEILALDGATRRRVEQADRLARKQGELARTCRYVDALAVAERRLEIYRETLARYPSEIVSLLTEMASILFYTDEAARAEAWLAEALELGREKKGPRHPWIADALSAQGRIRIEQGDDKGAMDILGGSLEMRRALYGPKHL